MLVCASLAHCDCVSTGAQLEPLRQLFERRREPSSSPSSSSFYSYSLFLLLLLLLLLILLVLLLMLLMLLLSLFFCSWFFFFLFLGFLRFFVFLSCFFCFFSVPCSSSSASTSASSSVPCSSSSCSSLNKTRFCYQRPSWPFHAVSFIYRWRSSLTPTSMGPSARKFAASPCMSPRPGLSKQLPKTMRLQTLFC